MAGRRWPVNTFLQILFIGPFHPLHPRAALVAASTLHKQGASLSLDTMHIYREALPSPRATIRRRQLELLMIAAAAVLTFLVSSRTELYESLHTALEQYEGFQADELVFVLLSLLAGLSVFSLLRWREARRELLSRISAERALQRLAARNRELAQTLIGLQEAERRRIAHELHDHFGQSCNAIRIDAVFLCKALPEGNGEQAAALRIADTADELYQTVRGLLYELRPAALDSLGLVGALQSLCEAWEERTEVSCALLPSGNLSDLGEQINIALFRIAQESLSNVVKHARASHVRISLRRESDAGSIELDIEDDGVGHDAASVRAGLGWLGMKERASMLGGELTIGQSRLGGVLVRCRVPPAAHHPLAPHIYTDTEMATEEENR